MVRPPEVTLLSLKDAITEYLGHLDRMVAGGAMSDLTRKTYKRDLEAFLTLADADAPADDLTGDDIDTIVLAYTRTPDARHTRTEGSSDKAPRTVARFRATLNGFFTFCQNKRYIHASPMPDSSLKPNTKTAIDESRRALPLASARGLGHLEPTRAKRADQDTSLRDKVIVRILLESGPRVAELCSLNVTSVRSDDTHYYLHIARGKGGKPRDIGLSADTHALLVDYIASTTSQRAAHETAMFLTYRGKRMTPRDVQNALKRLLRQLAPDQYRDATPHALRHTMATLALAEGTTDVATLQKAMGHASMATTGLYIDEIKELIAQIAEHSPATRR